MGLRFRKSMNLGPLRVNLSKSGVGYSVGATGFRATKKATGGYRTTASVPGTGVSYVKDYSSSPAHTSNPQDPSNHYSDSSPGLEGPTGMNRNSVLRWMICVVGWICIICGLLLSMDTVVVWAGVVVIGIHVIYHFSPFPCHKPLYRRKWFWCVVACYVVFVSVGLSSYNRQQSNPPVQTPPPVSAGQPLTSITLDAESTVELDINKTLKIPLMVDPSGAAAGAIQFFCSDDSVAQFYAINTEAGMFAQLVPITEGIVRVYVADGRIESNRITVTIVDPVWQAELDRQKQATADAKAAEKEKQDQTRKEEIVWVTEGSAKYHRDPSCSSMNNPSGMSVASAETDGRTACKKCF